MPIRLIAIAAGFLAAATACGKREEPQPRQAESPEVTARVERAVVTTLEDIYEATGTVRSRTTTIVSSQVMGNVMSVLAREGDRVKAGQSLAVIDAREARAQVAKARAGLREAENALAEVQQHVRAAGAAKTTAEANGELASATYKRFEALFERRSVSQQEFDEVKAKHKAAMAEVQRAKDSVEALLARERQVHARIDQAKADIENAKVYLGYARITAPITGIVTARQAELGVLAAPGVPLFTVEDPSRYRLEASVEESRIGSISVGEKVVLRIDALGGREMRGTVAEVVPAADPASRTYTVKIDIETGAEGGSVQLRSGLFGRAGFSMGKREILSVPRSALIERGQLVGLYTVDDQGVARFRLVKSGKERQGQVEILSGLSPGERFVAEGLERLADGYRVRGAAERQQQ